MKGVSATALFCEDIRKEAGSRETLIGVMPDTIRIQRFPSVIRRMTVHARIRISTDVADLDKLISISLSGKPGGLEVRGVVKEPIPKDLLEKSLKRAKEFGLPYASVFGQIRLDEPVPVKEPGVFMAHLHCGSETEVCGVLNIMLRDDTMVSPPPSAQSQRDASTSS